MQKLRAVVAENNIYRWAGKLLSALLNFEFPESTQAELEPEPVLLTRKQEIGISPVLPPAASRSQKSIKELESASGGRFS